MIRIVLYQNTNQKIAEAYGKWFPRVVSDETIGLEELAAHMASHNTPYSKGAILGMLTDAAACTKELLLLGKNVKFADIAIFSLGLKVKGGAPTKEKIGKANNILVQSFWFYNRLGSLYRHHRRKAEMHKMV